MIERQATCRQRWAVQKDSRMSEIRKLWRLYQHNPEASSEELGRWGEYGLSFDYVASGTFARQHMGYWRFQISYGGPSEEFRFYADHPRAQAHRITFAFLDWWDGYERKLSGKDEALMAEIWQDWQDTGSVQWEYDQAMDVA